MSLADNINADIKSAMLAKDKDRLMVLRDIKAKILIEATSGGSTEVSDDTVNKVVLKLYKQRMDSYTIYAEQKATELAAEELAQAKIIEEYMPKQLSEAEIRTEVQKAITQTGATSPADMGKVMGILSPALAGKADGKVISTLVKEELAK
jgi:uncharacterized protein YqeY